MALIKDLVATGPQKDVYRRADGQLYIKLNERFHVKTKLSKDRRTWLGDGTAEEFDPEEEVEFVA